KPTTSATATATAASATASAAAPAGDEGYAGGAATSATSAAAPSGACRAGCRGSTRRTGRGSRGACRRTASAARTRNRAGTRRHGAAHRPLEAIHTRFNLHVHGAGDRIVQQEFQLAGAQVGFRQDVDGRSALRIFGLELPVGGVPLGLRIVLPKSGRPRVEQGEIPVGCRFELFQRRD